MPKKNMLKIKMKKKAQEIRANEADEKEIAK